jgi:hypothetical protein|tara:strand:- start:3 stop:266 length:264 start_codon:yes stop_codon:yes gene_type:complete
MKFPNYLKNVFAGLGIVSLIFFTCAAADEVASDNDNNNNPQIVNTYGKYQISPVFNLNGTYYVYGLNTETGEAVRKTAFSDNILFTH